MNIQNVRRFAELKVELDKFEQLAKEVTKEMDALREPILKDMETEGVPNIPIDVGGGVTISVHRNSLVVPKLRDGATTDQLCDALKRAQLGDLVKESTNMNTFAAWVRERLAGGKPLPPSIDSIVTTLEVVSLRATRSTRSTKGETASSAAKATLAKAEKAKAKKASAQSAQ